MKRRIIFFLAVAIVAMLLAGCVAMGAGTLKVDVSIARALSPEDLGITRVVVTATSDKLTLTREVSFAGMPLDIDFGEVFSGKWTIAAKAYSSDGKCLYSGGTTVEVFGGVAARATAKLMPSNGSWSMTANLAALAALAPKPAMVKVYYYPLGSTRSILRHDFGPAFTDGMRATANDMPPGVYEYQLRAFDSSDKQLFVSPWGMFSVNPTEETMVTASFGSNSFVLEVVLAAIPPRPYISSFIISGLPMGPAVSSADIFLSGSEELAALDLYMKFAQTDRYALAMTYSGVGDIVHHEMTHEGVSGSGLAIKMIAIARGRNGASSAASDEAEFKTP